MVSLLDLETEVIALILEFVHDSSPATTNAVACVSRYFNDLTKSIEHRHKEVCIKGEFDRTTEVVQLVESWNHDQFVLSSIHTLTITGYYVPPSPYGSPRSEDEEDEQDNDDDDDDDDDDNNEEEEMTYEKQTALDVELWAPLVTLISRIGKLYQFTWTLSTSLPLPVLDALEQHQRTSTLRIFNFERFSVRATEPSLIEARLAKSHALTHLRLVWQNCRMWPDLQDAAFRFIVASAPNLEYAGFLSRNPSVDLTEHEEAQLKRWKQAFDADDKRSTSVKQLTLDGVELSKKTLDDWSTIIDPTSLHNVKFSRGVPTLDYFQHAATILPNLKHLSLNLRNIRARPDSLESLEIATAVKDYISDCPPLQSLSLWSWMGIIPLVDILQKHGATLETLQLHERETPTGRELLSVADVESIRHNCPRLRDFTFDLKRHHPHLAWDNDPNKQYYEELSKLERLNTLQIYFDMGLAYAYTPRSHGGIPVGRPGRSDEDYEFIVFSDLDESDDDNRDDSSNQTRGALNTLNASSSNPPNSASTLPSQSQLQSPSSPPRKKRRVEAPTRPSRDVYLNPYVQNIWRHVFGARHGGSRRLDVKFGEWEAHSRNWHPTDVSLFRWFTVVPHDRDDVQEPTVSIKTRQGQSAR